MAQGDFFSNLKNAQQSLSDARANGLITAQQEEDHMMKMMSYYEAINAKKAAGREWDLKNQTILQNISRFGKQMVEDAQNLKDAKINEQKAVLAQKKTLNIALIAGLSLLFVFSFSLFKKFKESLFR